MSLLFAGQYQPFTVHAKDWKKATGKDGKLFAHESSTAHKSAYAAYQSRKSEAATSVAAHLSKAYADRLQLEKEERLENRTALSSIIDIIRFLARQNISFRGHDESESSLNRGNFLELVHFTAKYNPSLNRWLENHPRNVSWLSPEIQNDLIHLLAVEVVQTIARECQMRYFSVMCDEVSDRSNSELLSVVVRYVLDSGFVNEALVGLIKVSSTTGVNLCDKIVKCLTDLHFDMNLLIGQCYDGASNMSGHYNGVQALLKAECANRSPLCMFTAGRTY